MRKPDRRTRKTRARIHEAFFALMREKAYEKIRVAEIAEQADISRATFYLHYETKDDLLTTEVDRIITSYFDAISDPDGTSPEAPIHILFSLWQENLANIRLIIDAGSEHLIYQRFRRINQARTWNSGEEFALLNTYVGTMLDGACFALLVRWTKDNAVIPIDQLTTLFSELRVETLFERLQDKLPNFGKIGG